MHDYFLSYLSLKAMEVKDISCFSPISGIFKRRSSKVHEVKIVHQNFTNMELYIKAGVNDGEVGDCPFAHYVRCVLAFKGLEYKVSHAI